VYARCKDPVSSAQNFAFLIISSQMALDLIALSKVAPCACPTGHTIPKFRMDAPTGLGFLSMTVTFQPLFESALVTANPTIPEPMTIADGCMVYILEAKEMFSMIPDS